jgi:ABC-type transport system involved in cytochrome c biogenesis permease subunit
MRLIWIVVAVFFIGVTMAFAAAPQPAQLDIQYFRQLPILHEGRIKPLESFARAMAKQVHGGEKVNGRPAVIWLADLMFRPEDASREMVIRAANPALRQTLNLRENDTPFYSFQEISVAINQNRKLIEAVADKEPEARNKDEKELLELYAALDNVLQIVQAFSLYTLMPEPEPALAKSLGIDAAEKQKDYLFWQAYRQPLQEKLESLVKTKGEDVTRYTREELAIANQAFLLTRFDLMGDHNTLMRVIPSSWDQKEGLWLSPWAVIRSGKGSPQTALLMKHWHALSEAYRAGDAGIWQAQSQRLYKLATEQGHAVPWRLSLELYKNLIPFLPLIIAGYGLAAMFLLLSRWKNGHSLAEQGGRIFLSTALALHLIYIVIRMLLLGRPPVGTLHESVLFVSMIAAGFGWYLDHRRGAMGEGTVLGAIAAAGLLLVSFVYAPAGDSLGILGAVLNSSFWLATHVLCITIGYAAAIIAGLLAHAYLFKPSPVIYRKLHVAGLFALLFTAVGTILGGIWADQSWGRFWGWDPKENGALLIVLWLVWAQHARHTGQLAERGYATWMAFLTIVVALSWFGTNLLGVGLHSYGFTDAAARGLAIFCLAEAVLIAILSLRQSWKYRVLRHD